MTNPRLPMDRLPKSDLPTREASQERFSDDELDRLKVDFAKRLLEAFNNISPAEIARRLKTSDATVSYYLKQSRLPISEMLIQIYKATGISLNWLLLGKGRKYVEYEQGFSDSELAEIEAMAKASGRTVQEELRALTLAGMEAVKKYQS